MKTIKSKHKLKYITYDEENEIYDISELENYFYEKKAVIEKKKINDQVKEYKRLKDTLKKEYISYILFIIDEYFDDFKKSRGVILFYNNYEEILKSDSQHIIDYFNEFIDRIYTLLDLYANRQSDYRYQDMVNNFYKDFNVSFDYDTMENKLELFVVISNIENLFKKTDNLISNIKIFYKYSIQNNKYDFEIISTDPARAIEISRLFSDDNIKLLYLKYILDLNNNSIYHNVDSLKAEINILQDYIYSTPEDSNKRSDYIKIQWSGENVLLTQLFKEIYESGLISKSEYDKRIKFISQSFLKKNGKPFTEKELIQAENNLLDNIDKKPRSSFKVEKIADNLKKKIKDK